VRWTSRINSGPHPKYLHLHTQTVLHMPYRRFAIYNTTWPYPSLRTFLRGVAKFPSCLRSFLTTSPEQFMIRSDTKAEKVLEAVPRMSWHNACPRPTTGSPISDPAERIEANLPMASFLQRRSAYSSSPLQNRTGLFCEQIYARTVSLMASVLLKLLP
jgi:hypothetical protein